MIKLLIYFTELWRLWA